MSKRVNEKSKTSWRDELPVHEAADLLPMISEPELREMGEDILANGMQIPLVLSEDCRQLIDGRNRLEALATVGSTICVDLKSGLISYTKRGGATVHVSSVICRGDPWLRVISANIKRRHLKPEDREKLLIELLARAPQKSDRQHANEVGVDHKTIAKARAKGEDVGRIPHVETRKDTKGRQQPAKRRHNAMPTEEQKAGHRLAQKQISESLRAESATPGTDASPALAPSGSPELTAAPVTAATFGAMLAALCVAFRSYANPPADLLTIISAEPAFDHADLVKLIQGLNAIDVRWKRAERTANEHCERAPADAADAAPAAGETKH
jgi:hypothetical protein